MKILSVASSIVAIAVLPKYVAGSTQMLLVRGSLNVSFRVCCLISGLRASGNSSQSTLCRLYFA